MRMPNREKLVMSAKTLSVAAGVSVLVGLAGYGAFTLLERKPSEQKPEPLVKREVMELKPEARISKLEKDARPEVQDHVTRAKIELAYQVADRGDFKAARVAFQTAAEQHKGTQAMHPAYGTLSDQAAYQAIVTLVAQGKKEEAIAEFRAFIKDRQQSPLVHAAFRRLERLHGGKATQQDEDLLQAAVTAQEKRIRFETSVCGPKVIEKLFALQGKKSPDYKNIAKMADTTDEGTTLVGMRKALKALGQDSFALELNRKDLASVKLPAIWLSTDHYVLLLKVGESMALVYDPIWSSEREVQLPPLDNAEFRAVLLTSELPQTDLVVQPPKPVKQSEKSVSTKTVQGTDQ